MRINAYILAADPAWLEVSIQSYYGIVDTIYVSYDEKGMGYTGVPVPVDECLSRLRAIDTDNKMRFSPGPYARLDHTPMENETHQRQCALDEASEGADWVLQIDSDEQVPDPGTFLSCLAQADEGGFFALDYPARWLYQQLGDGKFLELRDRFWRAKSFSPGPVAVKAGIVLKHARQTELKTFYVDFAKPSAKEAAKDGARTIHRYIPRSKAILHYSWVRTEDELRSKFSTWSHSKDRDWIGELDRWLWCKRHPYLAVLNGPLIRNSFVKYLGIVNVKLAGS